MRPTTATAFAISGQPVTISGNFVNVSLSGAVFNATFSGSAVSVSGNVVNLSVSSNYVRFSGQTLSISGQPVDISGQAVTVAGLSVSRGRRKSCMRVMFVNANVTSNISGQFVYLSPDNINNVVAISGQPVSISGNFLNIFSQWCGLSG